jgi:hypothetical protein
MQGWKLVVTGHSLGAGCASLIAMKLRPRFPGRPALHPSPITHPDCPWSCLVVVLSLLKAPTHMILSCQEDFFVQQYLL